MNEGLNGYFCQPKKETQIETYKRIKLLGQGSYGQVYLIQSTLTGIEYVCKDIDLSFSSEETQKSALQEVKILKKCKHPNITAFKEAFITRYPTRALHMVTEYADSGDLSQKINSQKKKNELFSENQIINWLIQICLALKYIHKLKIIHRDIKPSNIFLTKDDLIKIGDFGVSKALKKDQNGTRSAVGTPLYMPPEVIDSEKYDYKADIWSLGITFFEIMTFTLPFDGNNQMGLFNNIIEFKKKHSLNNYGTIYSEELLNIVRKMYSKNPNDRPTIDEILSVPKIKENYNKFIEINKNKYKEYQIDLEKVSQDIFKSNEESKNNLNTIQEENNASLLDCEGNGQQPYDMPDDDNKNMFDISANPEQKPNSVIANDSINNLKSKTEII
jgi:NIMA (never in mitosis gene a)-related kinase